MLNSRRALRTDRPRRRGLLPPPRAAGPRLLPPVRAVASTLLALLALAGCGPSLPGSAAPPALPTGVRAQHSERTYTVRGTTREEITRSLHENAIAVPGGRFRGMHRWRMRWSYRYAPGNSGCRMVSATVQLTSETHVPRWLDRGQADSALVAEWDTYMARLRTHENRHRAIAYQAAREVRRQLLKVSAPACTGMSGQANQVGQRIVRRHDERNRRYDEETGHGRTEGLAWPLPADTMRTAGG